MVGRRSRGGRPRRHRSRLARGARALRRGRAVADEAGDDYFVAICDMLLGYTPENCDRVRQLAQERGQRYVECIATMAGASIAVEGSPSAASAMLDDEDFRDAARESRYLRDFADRTAGRAALYLGDLERCLELARGLSSSPSLLMADVGGEALGRRRAARPR